MRNPMAHVISVSAFLIISFCASPAADPFVPGGPCTRGRVTLDGQAVLTDWGTRLRGACWSQDSHGDVFNKQDLAVLRECGLNSFHLYAEKNDDKPVGYESAHIDSIVEWSRQESLYVVMTFGDSYLADFSKVLDFWRFYAPRYKDMTHVIYEPKNEGCANTSGCEPKAVQCYHDCYKIIRDLAPETHIFMFSHSNIHAGYQALYDDIDSFPEVDWTNASIAFHGYSASGELQEEAAGKLGPDGYAMTCTEFWPGKGLENNYESAGIGYFHFIWCDWINGRGIEANCERIKPLNLSYEPDFGNWPLPHIERPAVETVWPTLSPESRLPPSGINCLIFNSSIPQNARAVYDLTGRLLWKARAGVSGPGEADAAIRIAPRSEGARVVVK